MRRTVSIIISMMCMASALMLTACDSNSNGSNANTALEQLQMNDPIVGTWQLNSCRLIVYNDGVLAFDESVSDCAGGFEFNKDGTYTRYTANGVPLNGEWSLLHDTYDGYYSLYTEFTDYFSQLLGMELTEYAPATHVAKLIDNQTLETEERFYNLTGEENVKKQVIELTSRFVANK